MKNICTLYLSLSLICLATPLGASQKSPKGSDSKKIIEAGQPTRPASPRDRAIALASIGAQEQQKKQVAATDQWLAEFFSEKNLDGFLGALDSYDCVATVCRPGKESSRPATSPQTPLFESGECRTYPPKDDRFEWEDHHVPDKGTASPVQHGRSGSLMGNNIKERAFQPTPPQTQSSTPATPDDGFKLPPATASVE